MSQEASFVLLYSEIFLESLIVFSFIPTSFLSYLMLPQNSYFSSFQVPMLELHSIVARSLEKLEMTSCRRKTYTGGVALYFSTLASLVGSSDVATSQDPVSGAGRTRDEVLYADVVGS